MPTKPTDTVPPWGDAGNYAAGGDPWSGQPRKVATNLVSFASAGFEPQQPDHASRMNEWLSRVREWARWTELGTVDPDEDAHIIESDVDGEVNLARLVLAGHSVAGPTLVVGSSASGASLAVTGPGGAVFGATFSNAGSAAAVRATQSGTGPAVDGRALGTNNDGVMGEAAGTGRGVYGLANDLASSFGVFGETPNDDGVAVRGQIPVTAGVNAAAVGGVGRGFGSGVLASTVGGASGYALFVFPDATSPIAAAIHIGGQDAEPSGADQEGDLYANSSTNLLNYRDDGGFKALHHSQFGYSEGFDGDAASSVSGAVEQALAASVVNNKVTADVYVSGTVNVGGTAGEVIEVKIRRGAGIGGTIIEQRDIELAITTASARGHSVAITGRDTGQAAGANTYNLTIRRAVGANTIFWSTNNLIARTIGD